ncbi:metal ABC transporter solute-binding protein, Zn/Mn family [Trichothermofontia sp.]
MATTTILCDLTQQIAAETIALTCLMGTGQDPHLYEPTPADRAAIADADLVLYDGYGASPKVIRLVESQSGKKRVAVYEVAVPTPRYVRADDHDHAHDHDHEHDHAHDHDHERAEAEHTHEKSETQGDSRDEAAHREEKQAANGQVPDPHIWHNARHNGAIVSVIAAQLAEVAPTHQAQYRQAADRLMAEFNALDAWIPTQVATVPLAQRQLITPHNAFGYFAAAYGFEVKGSLQGVSKAAKPSPAHLANLVEQVKSLGVPAIFAESTSNPEVMATIAREAGVKLAQPPLLVEGPTGPGTAVATTQQMLVHNTCTIVNNLGGRCQPPDSLSQKDSGASSS